MGRAAVLLDEHSYEEGSKRQNRLSDERRRALALLAVAGPLGQPEALMIEHGFTPVLLTALIQDRLALDICAWIRAGSKIIPITDIRITDAGGRLVAEA